MGPKHDSIATNGTFGKRNFHSSTSVPYRVIVNFGKYSMEIIISWELLNSVKDSNSKTFPPAKYMFKKL